jgi:hypothetical protein
MIIIVIIITFITQKINIGIYTTLKLLIDIRKLNISIFNKQIFIR